MSQFATMTDTTDDWMETTERVQTEESTIPTMTIVMVALAAVLLVGTLSVLLVIKYLSVQSLNNARPVRERRWRGRHPVSDPDSPEEVVAPLTPTDQVITITSDESDRPRGALGEVTHWNYYALLLKAVEFSSGLVSMLGPPERKILDLPQSSKPIEVTIE